MRILIVHETTSILEFVLHLLNFPCLFLDHTLHLLAKLLLEVFLLVFELLLNFSGSSLVLFQGLFAIDLCLSDTIVHALDLCLLFGDGLLVTVDFLLQFSNLLGKLLNLFEQVWLSLLELFFPLLSFLFKLLQDLGLISLLLCDLGLKLLVHRFDFGRVILT